MPYQVHVASMPIAKYHTLRQEFLGDSTLLEAHVQFMGPKAVIRLTPELQQQVSHQLLDQLFCFAHTIREEQFLSYFHQVNEVLKLPKSQSRSILEVGPGKGIFGALIKNYGYDVATVDLIPSHASDVSANVLSLPFRPNTFDMAVCFEVLEHLPYSHFQRAVKEMASVAKNYLFLSLPYQCNAIFVEFRLRIVQRFFHRFSGQYQLFFPFKARRQDIDEQAKLRREDKHNPHYWEMGRKSFPEQRILSDLENVGLTVVRKFHSPRKPYHFFILCKIN